METTHSFMTLFNFFLHRSSTSCYCCCACLTARLGDKLRWQGQPPSAAHFCARDGSSKVSTTDRLKLLLQILTVLSRLLTLSRNLPSWALPVALTMRALFSGCTKNCRVKHMYMSDENERGRMYFDEWSAKTWGCLPRVATGKMPRRSGWGRRGCAADHWKFWPFSFLASRFLGHWSRLWFCLSMRSNTLQCFKQCYIKVLQQL